jgi:type II secretory pathway pseudopilin PulG
MDILALSRPHRSAFTLLELLLVAGLSLALLSLALPAVGAIQSASQFSATVERLAETLALARTTAITQHRYVYVGFLQKQTGPAAASASASGPLWVLTAQSENATRGYDAARPSDSWGRAYGTTLWLKPQGRLQSFERVHLASTLGAPPETGPMGKTAGRQDVGRFYRLGHEACRSVTPLTHPLNTAPDSPQCELLFEKVIQFDPQGTARIQYASNGDEIKQCIEIGLLPIRGAHPPADEILAAQSNCAALQLSPLTGAIRIYRP